MDARRSLFAFTFLLICAGFARGEDLYFRAIVGNPTGNGRRPAGADLANYVEGQLPKDANATDYYSIRFTIGPPRPYATVDGDGEAYVVGWGNAALFNQGRPGIHPENPQANPTFEYGKESSIGGLVVRAPRKADVTGHLYVAKPEGKGMLDLKFKDSGVGIKRAVSQGLLAGEGPGT